MPRIDLHVPEGWEEVTLEQFRIIAEASCLNLDKAETLTLAFLRLAGVKSTGKNGYVTQSGEAFVMKDWQLADFCDRLSWILDADPDTLPNPTGVDDYLRDVTFGDWYEADTLMRDKGPEAFNGVKRLLKITRGTDDVDVVMVRKWWVRVSDMLACRYPMVLKGDGGGSERNPFQTLQDMLLMVNDDKPQENTKILDANVHDVLAAINHKIIVAREREKLLNRH